LAAACFGGVLVFAFADAGVAESAANPGAGDTIQPIIAPSTSARRR
jgi:hypothetical protein